MTPTERQLAALQRQMQEALIFPRDATAQTWAAEVIAPSARLSGVQRLAIYQRGYYARLLECMRGQFKALAHALGDELFDDFAREYLQMHPSSSHTLSELGARFPSYLATTRPDADLPLTEREPWADFIVDLARFEWDLYTMFDQVGHEGKPYAQPIAHDQGLRVQPCLSLGRYAFPVHAYYRQVRDARAPDFPDPFETHVALVRTDFQVGVFVLRPLQFRFLLAMRSGCDVEGALLQVAQGSQKSFAEIQAAWQAWREPWLSAGFFIESSPT